MSKAQNQTSQTDCPLCETYSVTDSSGNTSYAGRNVVVAEQNEPVMPIFFVDPNVEGLYYVTYNVQDSDGINANPLTLKVVVTDINNPIDYRP